VGLKQIAAALSLALEVLAFAAPSLTAAPPVSSLQGTCSHWDDVSRKAKTPGFKRSGPATVAMAVGGVSRKPGSNGPC